MTCAPTSFGRAQAHRFLSELGVVVMPKDAEVCVVCALRGLSEDTLRTRKGCS